MPFPSTDDPALQDPLAKPGKATRLSQSLPKVNPQQGIAHRMANDIGVAIVSGELKDGARILEEELAAHYGVSRSPVREAIGLLERRGLVRTEPRRGTYVVGFTPDLIADLFNVRGVLTGLAARYVARQRDPQALADLRDVAQALAQANQQADITPMQFAKVANGLGVTLLRHCGSDVLRRMVSDHGHMSSWGVIWRDRPMDFQTPERRQQMTDDYATLCELMAAWNDVACEAWLRKMLDDNREHVLRELQQRQLGTAAPQYQLQTLTALSEFAAGATRSAAASQALGQPSPATPAPAKRRR
ncbi:GntR family transcriptional regulator [Comamonas serinivorans]|nr:GntR family transcriptional regulator [Comamonas serinivorans]